MNQRHSTNFSRILRNSAQKEMAKGTSLRVMVTPIDRYLTGQGFFLIYFFITLQMKSYREIVTKHTCKLRKYNTILN